MSKQRWGSRLTFILAAIGSAVGLGNCWRFPGLVAKHGGGAFLLVYILALVVLGIPLLTMEIAIARRMRGGAPKALKGIHPQAEKVGWSAVFNGFVICCYYAIVFAWVIAMIFAAFSFGGMDGSTQEGLDAAGNLFGQVTQTTWGVEFTGAGGNIPIWMLLAAVVAWGLIYFCIRNGAHSVSKVVKYTVFIPVALLLVLAFKGFIANANLGEAMYTLFVPDWSAFSDPTLWIDAFGQVFFSLSIMMAIMFAYGSYLKEDANIAEDALIIAVSDMLISVLSSVVLFSTMYSTGMTVDNMSASGIGTAFLIYPKAIVQFTNIGWVNAMFGVIFYLTLATLAIDSAFSIAEGVSKAFSDKFGIDQKKVTKRVVLIMAAISIIFITGAGLGWLDIVDNWTNQINLIIIGVAECICVGWFFKPSKVWEEINKNTNKYKMPKWWLYASVKFVAPVALAFFCGWNIVHYFLNGGYGYPIWAEIIGGWLITAIVLAAGFIMKALTTKNKKLAELVKIAEADEKTWDEMGEIQDAIRAGTYVEEANEVTEEVTESTVTETE
ncbi:MAG: sodium-dependent transporter [Clostridia bacterium]|nr:sodium-dependent transporter [Clostridia bacterium]